MVLIKITLLTELLLIESKVMKKLTMVLSFLFFSLAISAQDVDMMIYQRDVNGIKVGTRLTREQVVAEFGEPTRYVEQDSGDNGVDRYYYYGNTYIHTNEHIFDEFALRDAAFTAFTTQISEGLKVGQPLSKLDNFMFGKPQFDKQIDDEIRYKIFYTTDSPVDIYVKDGIIVRILYHDPI